MSQLPQSQSSFAQLPYVIQAHLGAINKGDEEAFIATFSYEALFRSPAGRVRGHDDIRALVTQSFAQPEPPTMVYRNHHAQSDTRDRVVIGPGEPPVVQLESVQVHVTRRIGLYDEDGESLGVHDVDLDLHFLVEDGLITRCEIELREEK